MTAYNREKYIGEAIESVLASSFRDFELLIVDDKSTDHTVSIAEKYAAHDSRIKIYLNKINLGDYPNRNQAASYAKARYIMFCDSDDTLLPDGILNCVKSMELFPQAGFGLYYAYRQCPAFTRSPEDAARINFFEEPFLGMGPGATILLKEYFFKIGGYPVKYGPANDMYFNLKAICYSDTVLIPAKFSEYRIHENQERNQKISYLLNGYIFLRDALIELPLPLTKEQIRWIDHKNKRRFVVNIFKYILSGGKLNEAVKVYKNADFSLKNFKEAVFNFA